MSEFKTVDQFEIVESPTAWIVDASGRARCRICGEKIAKGRQAAVFYASLNEESYNPWAPTKCHAHVECAPNVEINPRIQSARWMRDR